jgi:four helix bundle protein
MLEDLKIYQKVYDLILYAFPIINRFPKNQRFVLGQQLENSMINIVGLIVEANSKRNKGQILRDIDIELQKLKTLIRLAKDLAFISIKRYKIFAEKLMEIGRLLGGWMKSCGIQQG